MHYGASDSDDTATRGTHGILYSHSSGGPGRSEGEGLICVRTACQAIALALAAMPLGEVLEWDAEDAAHSEGGSWVRG